MKSILRSCLYLGKNLFRDFGFSFWSLVYPLILVSFFHVAFSGLTNIKYENVNVGVEKENPIIYVLKNTDMVNVYELTKDQAVEKIESGDLDGFIDMDFNIAVKKSGINQTIIKSIVDQVKQMNASNIALERFDFSVNYIGEKEQKANGILVIFYSMIAMVTAYSIFAGVETVSLAQGNLTNIGARLNVTPLKKMNFILAGTIIGIILNLFANVILLLYIRYILKMNLFTEIKYSFIFIMLGNLFGISLGIFIGASNKKSIGVKTLISIATMLILSFLSGLMSPDVKIMLDRKIPILGKVNPVGIISNNLYRINLLENTKDIGSGIFILIAYSVILVFGSYMFLRGRNYDSI